MTGVIEALENEVKFLEESITKHKNINPYIITELTNIRVKVKHALVLLKEGEDLHMMCGSCGLVLPACEYEFSTIIEECSDCGHHIRIESICPKCGKIRVIFQDRNFEGE